MTLEERFFSKTQRDPSTGCLLWTAQISNKGYACIWFNGRKTPAHRVAWFIHTGQWPGDSFVCHRCDTPLCVESAHLFLGAPADNMRDKAAKRRGSCGPEHPSAKLDFGRAEEIRAAVASGVSQDAVARLYGVSQSAVSAIVRRKTWKSPVVNWKRHEVAA